jgi:hypothetical protein
MLPIIASKCVAQLPYAGNLWRVVEVSKGNGERGRVNGERGTVNGEREKVNGEGEKGCVSFSTTLGYLHLTNGLTPLSFSRP